MKSSNWLVYVIQSTTSARTYVGCTNNFSRRIRQHNGEIVGGAKYTRGNSWAPVVLVQGFASDQRHALQFEWRLKDRRRRGKVGCSGVDRRVTSLHHLLGLEKATAKAPPLCETEISLEWHSATAQGFFANLLAASPLPPDLQLKQRSAPSATKGQESDSAPQEEEEPEPELINLVDDDDEDDEEEEDDDDKNSTISIQ